jgi:hypothetical protein
MQSHINRFIILYLAISIIWLIISLIINLVYQRNFLFIVFFVFTTIIYIPVALWYIRDGESYRVRQATYFTIGLLIVYLFVEALIGLTFFIDTT